MDASVQALHTWCDRIEIEKGRAFAYIELRRNKTLTLHPTISMILKSSPKPYPNRNPEIYR